ncbi:hypothetical protein [Agarilytica rhodophyticola]|uniref:hypothetical protein n=1 Tax=Agarilytica rhodophyticola TaxID=1737490 RepID=UPI000B3418BE|nr:hypothetical protein [Agarilytica rhodophyticola]
MKPIRQKLPALTAKAYGMFSELAIELEENKLKSLHGLPLANCQGCYVQYAGGSLIKFSFIAHGTLDQITSINIDIEEASKNPQQYFEYILEDVNNAHKEFKKSAGSEIYMPPQTKLSQSIKSTVH